MGIFKKLKRLFKKNWQVLAAIGWGYIEENLMPRVRLSNPYFARVIEKVAEIGDEAIDRLTDNETDDKSQMKELLELHIEDLVVLTATGAITEVNDPAARLRIAVILEDTAKKLKSGNK